MQPGSEQTAVEIRGLPEKKLKGLNLSDISLSAPVALVCDEADEVSMNNVVLSPDDSMHSSQSPQHPE